MTAGQTTTGPTSAGPQSPGPRTTGQIHDLGYKRYVGSRRSVGTRWRVIMRHQIATAWIGWWRFKLWLIAAALATAITGGILYFLRNNLLRMIGGVQGAVLTLADGLLPLSTLWYCKIGFLVSLTISATAVAGDVQSGAFTFYFARSVRPYDYVVGKLAGIGALLAMIMLAGPVVLAGVRLGLSDDLAQLITLLPVLYKELAIGLLGTLIYTAVPLGFSALVTNRRHALAVWAAYYLVIGLLAVGLGRLVSPAIAALDLPSSLHAISRHLFDTRLTGRDADPPTSAALISILGHAAVAIGLVAWRVRNAQQTGVGGSS
ncbi:MAG TPA: ABC transporter permease subunit [Kofleriaceae bacterium]|jgi:hypothetical protein